MLGRILVIAHREFVAAVFNKAFIIGVLAVPLIMAISIGAQFYAQKKTDVTPRRFAVLDRSGQLYAALAAQAKARNESLRANGESVAVPLKGQTFKVDMPPQPEFVPEEFKFNGDDLKAAELQLSERVRRKELFAFVIIGPNVLDRALMSSRM